LHALYIANVKCYRVSAGNIAYNNYRREETIQALHYTQLKFD